MSPSVWLGLSPGRESLDLVALGGLKVRKEPDELYRHAQVDLGVGPGVGELLAAGAAEVALVAAVLGDDERRARLDAVVLASCGGSIVRTMAVGAAGPLP